MNEDCSYIHAKRKLFIQTDMTNCQQSMQSVTVWTNKTIRHIPDITVLPKRSTLVFHSFSIIQIFKIYGVSGWQYRLESMVCIILANKTVVVGKFAVKTKKTVSRCSLSHVIVCAGIALTRYVILFDSRAECKMDTHTVANLIQYNQQLGYLQSITQMSETHSTGT